MVEDLVPQQPMMAQA